MIHAMCNRFYILNGKCYIVNPYASAFAAFDLADDDRIWTGYYPNYKSYSWKELKHKPQEDISSMTISNVEFDDSELVPDDFTVEYIESHIRTFYPNSRVRVYKVELQDLLKVCKEIKEGGSLKE